MLWAAVMKFFLLYAVFTSVGGDPETNCQDVQAKYERLVIEKDLMEKSFTDLQTKYDRLVIQEDLMEKNLTDKDRELQDLKVKCKIQDVFDVTKKYKVDVTLDPDTAHPKLRVSGDGKQVRRADSRLNVPDNPERFGLWDSVLGKEGFSSGRFYYEVQVKDKTEWFLGVARESINRKGLIGLDPRDGTWLIGLYEAGYKAYDYPVVPLSLSQQLLKVGVFVDYEQGEVSFYDPDHRSHLYSFTGLTFTGKLYPYLNPCGLNAGNNTAPLVITPVE